MTRKPVLLLLCLLASSAIGCSRVREISACRSIVREVNGALDEIEKLAGKDPLDAPRIARRYADLAKALAPHAKGESALAAAVRDYVAVIQSTEAALTAHASEGSHRGKGSEHRRELERISKRERSAAGRVENECQH